MLIKIENGKYEVNPDHITAIEYNPHYRREEHRIKIYVGSMVFSISEQQLAQISTYHTKTVVIHDSLHQQADDALRRIGATPFVIPKNPERTEEQKKIDALVARDVSIMTATTNLYCSMCKNKHSKECNSCIDIDVPNKKMNLKRFIPLDGVVPIPDCSGTQHEKEEKRCSKCTHSLTHGQSLPCVKCNNYSHFIPVI